MSDLQRLLQDDTVDTINDEDVWASWRIATSFSSAALCFIMSFMSIFIIFTIVTTPTLRSFNFYIYIIFILAPDAFLNAIDGTQSIYRGLRDGVGPAGLCYTRVFSVIFYYYSNIFVNACVAKEVFTLVWTSYNLRRTKPPTLRKVLTQVGISYGIAGLITSWQVIPWRASLLTISVEPACMPTFGSKEIPGMVSFFFCALTTVPFLIYVLWVGYKVKTQNLLPVSGRTRVLALFFFRIVVNFLIFYTPMFIVAMLQIQGPAEDKDSNYHFALYLFFSTLVPVQNIVTVKLLMDKEEIAAGLRAPMDLIVKFFHCQRTKETIPEQFESLEDVYEDIELPTTASTSHTVSQTVSQTFSPPVATAGPEPPHAHSRPESTDPPNESK